MSASKILPLPGEVFTVRDRPAFLIQPAQPADGRPWVWYAPTLAGLPGPEEHWMFERFTQAGLAVAGIDVGESCGNPAGRALFTEFYQELVTRRGFSAKACLLARSRGGLQHYNWAVEHPTAVACVAGIYPVCDLASFPGIVSASVAYGLTAGELTDRLGEHNPVRRVGVLARAGVPVFHIHGDGDELVPLTSNSGAVAQEYERAGGRMTLRIIQGQGHNMWDGWFQCQELVDFVLRNSLG